MQLTSSPFPPKKSYASLAHAKTSRRGSLRLGCAALAIGALLMLATAGQAQNSKENVTVSGYVRDQATGELLIGATIYIAELQTGAITNAYGFYSVSLAPSAYNIRATYIGFASYAVTLELIENKRLDIELAPEDQQLEEVVVEGNKEFENVESISMSANRMTALTLTKMPAFMGEPDVLKSLLMLPGVSTVGEGASGFNVRGGSVGQNVTLLDEAPIYNPSHVFGLFSVFNSDAMKDFALYKGAVPARYGGRVSSVLDIHMRDGDNKNLTVKGGIGDIFARLAVEGPIVKDKASFIVAARRSYFDLFTSLFVPDLKDTRLNFYDITVKANYAIDSKNTVYLSGYFGQDTFRFDKDQGFNWGNITGALRWNHLYNDRLFSNTTFSYGQYNYRLAFGSDNRNSSYGLDWRSYISTFILKPQFSYFLNRNNEISFGAELTYHTFRPGEAQIITGEGSNFLGLDRKYALEAAAYASNQQRIGRILTLEYGLRISHFSLFGPGDAQHYGQPEKIGMRKPLISSTQRKAGESIANYLTFEPRAAFKVQLGHHNAIKGSYNRMSQYLHLTSNATASTPLDVWVPSSNNIKPEISDQFTLGYFRNLTLSLSGRPQLFEVSLEGYYRETQNEIAYIDGADLLLNRNLEGDLLPGTGRAYGMEFYLHKKTGRFTGWLSYTLSRTELQVNGVNRGDWYPARYDQTNNLKLALFYDINERISLSCNFVYITGAPTTFPTSRYWIDGTLLYHNTQDTRNNVRLPDYHRLDLSVRIHDKPYNKHGKKKKLQMYWDVSLYNVYARQNPFSISFSTAEKQPSRTVATQLAILGTIIPGFSWNFKFVNDGKK